LLLFQPAASSTSGASCSKDVKDSSEEETTDEEEDSEDDEQWNSEDAENDKLYIYIVVLFRENLIQFRFCAVLWDTPYG